MGRVAKWHGEFVATSEEDAPRIAWMLALSAEIREMAPRPQVRCCAKFLRWLRRNGREDLGYALGRRRRSRVGTEAIASSCRSATSPAVLCIIPPRCHSTPSHGSEYEQLARNRLLLQTSWITHRTSPAYRGLINAAIISSARQDQGP